MATMCASTSPVIFGGTGGVIRFFRWIATCKPLFAYAVLTFWTVVGDVLKATAVSATVICFLFALSEARRMLALNMALAGEFPFVTILRKVVLSDELSSIEYFTDGILYRPPSYRYSIPL